MYPSLYYAIKDLLGVDLPFMKMIQSFGFFVAIAFLCSAYLLSKELQRKEKEGKLSPHTQRILIGQKATPLDFISSGLIGFLLGFKLLYIFLNFSEFTANTQGFLLSAKGSILGAIGGAAISIYLKYREKEKTKLATPVWKESLVHPYQEVGNITLIAAFTGLIGAKIFHNLENWDTFVADPMGALLSFDGLTMYGGLICASIACIWYGRKKGIATRHLIDTAAPPLMLGYGIGRIGCHVAGDGDWGIANMHPKPSWLNWAPDWFWKYDYPHNVVNEGVPLLNCSDRYCHHLDPAVFPTAMYESIVSILLFFLLWKLRKRITVPGMLFSIYLILNGFERFFIEKIRVNTLYHVGTMKFTQAELISSLLFITGFVGVWYFRKKHREELAKG